VKRRTDPKKSEKSPLTAATPKEEEKKKKGSKSDVYFSLSSGERVLRLHGWPIARDCSGLSPNLLLFALLIRTTTRLKKER
tara:strand:- start:257 stop:499 length:243 start_codon:yes stop_codon:yes gene_type:complete